MPTASTPKEFAEAVAEGRSRVTKALDDLFRPPQDLRTHPQIGALRGPGFFNAPIPVWVRDELKARGVAKQREFNHVNNWPPTQKEALRQAMVHAIDHDDVQMRFFWELFAGAYEETVIEPYPLPPAGLITVRFRSPQSRVRYANGEILTDVG